MASTATSFSIGKVRHSRLSTHRPTSHPHPHDDQRASLTLPPGELRHISKLRFWPLPQVLREKYILPPDQVDLISGFLMPMMRLEPEKRISARDALKLGWLEGVGEWFAASSSAAAANAVSIDLDWEKMLADVYEQASAQKRVTEGKENEPASKRRSYVNGVLEVEDTHHHPSSSSHARGHGRTSSSVPAAEADAMKPADFDTSPTANSPRHSHHAGDDNKEREKNERELREMMYGRAAVFVQNPATIAGPPSSVATSGGGGGSAGKKKKKGKK